MLDCTTMGEQFEEEKCHYCGKAFEPMRLTAHLRESTEVIAELPALLGTGNGTGSIDLHEGQLYMSTVKPGPCMDEVKTEPITGDRARMMILAELNYHKTLFEKLSSVRERVLDQEGKWKLQEG